MPTQPRTSGKKKNSPARRLIGSASNILLLGFLAGVYAGYSIPPQAMIWVARLTLLGFAASVVITLVMAIRQIRAEQSRFESTKAELERRMERLIPHRRSVAHGTHSHRPHKRDVPAAQRSI